MIEINSDSIDYIARSTRHNQILNDIDKKYESVFNDNTLEKLLEVSLNSPLVSYAYKKAMCLQNFFNYKITPFESGIEKLKVIGMVMVYPFWILAQIGIPSLSTELCKKYQVGFMGAFSSWSLNNKYRSLDFLLNGHLSKENTIFCIEEPIMPGEKELFTLRGYNWIELRKILHGADIKFIYHTILKKQISVWLSLLLKSFTEPPYITRLTLEIIYKSALWLRFLEKYHLQHYVSTNEYLPADVVRYIHLNRVGVKTWCYIHSCSTDDFITPPRQDDILSPHYSYFAYHHLIVWGEKMEKYYRKHPGHIQYYDHFGCLWSELIRIAKENPKASEVLIAAKEKFKEQNIKKIIGVFDTSFTDKDTQFVEACPLNYKDMIAFTDGLFRLLEEFPEICILFKNKLSYNSMQIHTPEIIPYYQKLIDHPRCYFPYLETTCSDPTEITAASDLIISAPFTSPCIEALGAGIKAIYYDASHKFPGCYYDRIPQFVAHNYNELKDFVEYWLYKTTPEEFDTFLNEYIKGELEENIDGKAISRFREKLSVVSENDEQRPIDDVILDIYPGLRKQFV